MCELRRWRLAERASSDEGYALFTVVVMATVLFMLTTAFVTLELYHLDAERLRTKRVSATHVADAGLNEYLYHIRNEESYFVDHPSTGWVPFAGGRYCVEATPPQDGRPLTLRATGNSSIDGTITLVATVSYPSFADYMFLSDTSIDFGSGARVEGHVRSNGDVSNSGYISGKTYAGGSISGPGQFAQGKFAHQPKVDFATVLPEMDTLLQAAKANGTWFGPSGASGYRVNVYGTTISVEKVTGGITSGNLTTQMLASFPIPADGAVYFGDKIWVQGAYDANVTIGCDADIYISNDYKRSNSGSGKTSGLISKRNVIIPSWYSSVPQSMVVNAAVLAQSGQFYADMKDGVTRTDLEILGSNCCADSTGGFVTVDQWDRVQAGFRTRQYVYDPALDSNAPPFFPVIKDGSLKVKTWVENGGVHGS